MWCSFLPPPPLLFIGGSQGAPGGEVAWASRNRLLEPTKKRHVEDGAEGAYWQVGRQRWLADRHVARTDFNLLWVTDMWAYMSVVGAPIVIGHLTSSGGPMNPRPYA